MAGSSLPTPIDNSSIDGLGRKFTSLTYTLTPGMPTQDFDLSTLPAAPYWETITLDYAGFTGLDASGNYNPANAYRLAVQYGQNTATVTATPQAGGAPYTVAVLHDLATVQLNGQWIPVTGADSSYLHTSGTSGLPWSEFEIDTGPKFLLDQTGGATTNGTVTLSGNVLNYLLNEQWNYADGTVVNIADNGVPVASATVQSKFRPGAYYGPDDTAWSASVNLTPGANHLTFTTTDRDGQTGTASLDYVYSPPGTPQTGTPSSPTTGQTGGSGSGQPTGGTPAPVAGTDGISLDPGVTFLGQGTFALTGHVASTVGVKQVELTADVDGTPTDLGAAAVNADGSFTFTDQVGAHTQSFLSATLTNRFDQTTTTEAPFSLEAGIAGAPYVAEQDVYNLLTGAVSAITRFHRDGSRVVQVEEPGQTLTSTAADTFLAGAAANSSFVFQPGYGFDVVRGFHVAGDSQDTLSLPAADFASIADVLRHTQADPGGALIHDPASGDVIRLAGVSKAQLAHNSQDLALHG